MVIKGFRLLWENNSAFRVTWLGKFVYRFPAINSKEILERNLGSPLVYVKPIDGHWRLGLTN